MPDVQQLRKRLLWRALGSPLVITPFLAGMTALTAVWALDLPPGLGAFAALAGALASAGIYVTRLALSGGDLMRQVTDEAHLQEEKVRQENLDALDQDLTAADDDPRPEVALRDLRALVKAFEEAEKTSIEPGQIPLVIDIRARVDQLFEQCAQSLRRSGQIWRTAERLNNKSARQPLVDQRERLIADVQSTIRQLSETLVALQTLGAGAGSSRELTRLRSELDQSLAIARTVEERVSNLMSEIAAPTAAPPPSLKPKLEE